MRLTTTLNPEQQPINEFVEVGTIICQRYAILTTPCIDYVAWERIDNILYACSTITHHDTYGWLGDLTTRALTPELDALPAYSRERSEAVRAYFAGLQAQAEAAIVQAFPQDFAAS